MTEIRLSQNAIERIISQVLRDEYKLLPGKANEAATAIGRRLAVNVPTSGVVSALQGARLIRRVPARGYREEYYERHSDPNHPPSPHDIWEVVYKLCPEVPAVIADAYNF